MLLKFERPIDFLFKNIILSTDLEIFLYLCHEKASASCVARKSSRLSYIKSPFSDFIKSRKSFFNYGILLAWVLGVYMFQRVFIDNQKTHSFRWFYLLFAALIAKNSYTTYITPDQNYTHIQMICTSKLHVNILSVVSFAKLTFSK